MNPKLFIEQKITAFANQYKVYRVDASGTQGQLIAFAQQKRLAVKEKVTFYSDENKTNIAFTFRAEKLLDVHGRYLVEDANGVVIGMFKKEFKQSLISSTWKILDQNSNDMFMVAESSVTLALFRRYAGWVPVVGGLIELVTQFLRYHFVFTHVSNEEVIGTYEKTTLFRDHYTLKMNDEAVAVSDWRVLAAMGVALDALQSR